MLNLTQIQAQNSYNNQAQMFAANRGQSCGQSFGQNPMMMMAMTMMASALMTMMSNMMGNQNGGMPMGQGSFGNNNGMNGGSGLNDFLGGNCPCDNNGGYHTGLNFDQNPNRDYNNHYPNDTNNNSNTNNSNSCNGTGKSNGVGKDLPEGVDGISYDKACQMVKNAGGQLNPGGKPTVLALRSKNTTSRTYQDAFVVLKPDHTMEKFSANTRPTSAGQDKAMLKNGEYDIKPRWKDGKFHNDGFVVGSTHANNNVGVARDRNGDGNYSQDELNGNASSNTIRLHRGKSNGTTSSAGCLNVKDYDGFLGAVGGDKANFNMVLVTL